MLELIRRITREKKTRTAKLLITGMVSGLCYLIIRHLQENSTHIILSFLLVPHLD